MQLAMSSPISSKPVLQVYIAMSPTEVPVPVVVTAPLSGAVGLAHKAGEDKRYYNNSQLYYNNGQYCTDTVIDTYIIIVQ